jgi:hypothetical protein
MHKGIRITVRLWVEGEDEPAHDFAASTIKAVREMLAAGQSLHPGLQVTVRKVEEDTSWDEEEGTG